MSRFALGLALVGAVLLLWPSGTPLTANALYTRTASVPSNSFSATTLQPPTNVSATGGSTIALSWTTTSSSYAAGYRILRSTSASGPFAQVGQVTPRSTTSYVDSPATGTYYYVVRAYYQNWESVDSNQDSATRVPPIAFVGHLGSNTSASSTATLSITVGPAGAAAGDLVVVRTALRSTNGVAAVTDSSGNSYAVAGVAAPGTTTVRSELWYSRLATALQSGDTITVTWGASDGNRRAIAADEFSGVDAILDAANTATGNSTSPSASLTTSNTDDLVIGYTGVNGPASDTYTEAAGWTALTRVGTSGSPSSGQVTADGGYKIVSAAGTYAHAPTLGAGRNWGEVIAAFNGQ